MTNALNALNALNAPDVGIVGNVGIVGVLVSAVLVLTCALSIAASDCLRSRWRSAAAPPAPPWREGGPAPMLWVVTALHVGVVGLVGAWPLVVGRAWDSVFVAGVSIIAALWIVLRGECLLSYVEKRCVYAPGAYHLGDAPLRHWCSDVLPPRVAMALNVCVIVITLSAVALVAARNTRLTATAVHIELSLPPCR
jgi:hypothetical protein